MRRSFLRALLAVPLAPWFAKKLGWNPRPWLDGGPVFVYVLSDCLSDAERDAERDEILGHVRAMAGDFFIDGDQLRITRVKHLDAAD